MTDSNMRPCPNCGTPQPVGVKYCANCNASLIGMETLSLHRAEIDERDPTLRIVPDSGTPYTVLLHHKIMDMGSEAHQDIPIQMPGIALRHARLTLVGTSYRLYDITGKRGVLVNNQPIDTLVLKDGDIIRLQDPAGQGVTMTYSNPLERGTTTKSVGRMYMFEKLPFTIGRDPDSTVQLEALAVSWRHSEITEQGKDQHVIADLGSTNGTFVNDRRITGPTRLQPEDVVRIDRVMLVYKSQGLLRLPSVQRFQIDGVDLGMTYKSGFPRKEKNTMRDVSISIHPQEFVAVIGGSGSSKSTLLRALNGANRATEGRVYINGDDMYANYPLYQPIIGYVPQSDIVQNELTVFQVLMFGARLRFPNEPKASREQRITRVLEALELTEFREQLVRSLSGGQKKRVSIALELMAEPGLLFMDEPSSGLDPGLDKSMMDTLRRLADRGHVVVVVTHTTLNIGMCDQLALMARGNLAYYGPPKEALSFFGVRDYPEIYNRVFETIDEDNVEDLPPNEASKRWAAYFKTSALYVKSVAHRLMNPSDNVWDAHDEALSNKTLRGRYRGTFLQQARVLTERTLTLALHDSRTMLAMLLVLPLIGLFLATINFDNTTNVRGQMLVSRGSGVDFIEALDKIPTAPITANAPPDDKPKAGGASSNVKEMATFTPANDAQRLLFMMSLAVALLGIFASAYTIVEEKSLFLRERMVNLRIPPYLTSKVVVYAGFAMLSCILLLIIVSLGVQLPAKGLLTWGPLEMFITLALTAIAGISIGLLLSAFVRQTNAVTYAVLGVLFVQILFPGVLFKMEGALEPLSKITITRWSLEALGATADMTARNAEGRIIVVSPVLDPKTKKPLPAAGDTKQFLPAPASLGVTYPTSQGDLLLRWGVLAGFSVLFLVLAGVALNRSESF
jgi:ABC-type multidrug transport system ATPase subunit/pSer/pThr/pTyr-binding forkhead associated (FHA) protein